MPPIHLWVYNHSFYGIGDQVSFAVMAFRQHGYQVSVGQQPRYSSLNVVIEGFSSQSRDILLEFCQSTRKRVAMIMTEHIDAEHGQILVHGAPLGSENDYMHPATILARIKHLLECIPYLRCFFVLGDLPELRNMSTMLPGVDVRAIPFPRLDNISDKENIEYSEEKGSEYMKNVICGIRDKFTTSRKLIASLKAKRILIKSTRLKWLLAKGAVVTNIWCNSS